MHNYIHKGCFPMGPHIYWYYWVVFSTGWIRFHSTVSTDQGLRQSPVDIATKAMSYDSELRNNPLVFSYKYEQDIEIHNNGYTIVVPIKQPSSKYLQVSRIPLHELLVICIRGVTINRYIGISQYTKNLYSIAIRNAYRNISRVFFFLIKLFTFHSILVLQQLLVQKVLVCNITTL